MKSKTLQILPLLIIIGLACLWQYDARGGFRSLLESRTTEHQMVDEVIALLRYHYDGPVDHKALYESGLVGITNALNDPYTTLWAPSKAKRQAEEQKGEFFGIGIRVNFSKDGSLFVVGVNPSGPAYRAGLRAGDRIESIDGRSLRKIESAEVSSLIRGKLESKVKLAVRRLDQEGSSQTFEVSVERENIIIHSVQGARLLEETKIGYVRIASFALNTAQQFESSMEKLQAQGMEGLILDLRHNPGGSLDAVTKVADMLIGKKEGLPIVSTKAGPLKLQRLKKLGAQPDLTSRGTIYTTKDNRSLVKVPIVVLQNRYSASASEVLIGALQDYNLAFIIGEPSFGKGVIQETVKLGSHPEYKLKVTVASYYTPLGNSFRRNQGQKFQRYSGSGVEPDFYYPLTQEQEFSMLQRFDLLTYELPQDKIKDFITLDEYDVLRTQDPHIEAAKSYFRNEAIVMPLHASQD